MLPISTDEEMPTMIMATFDTKTGLYLTRVLLVPTPRLVGVQSIRVSVKASNGAGFRLKSVTRLSVEIGGHNAKAVSGVMLKVWTRVIVSTALIDRKNYRIERTSRQYIPKSGHAVAVAASLKRRKRCTELRRYNNEAHLRDNAKSGNGSKSE